MTLADGIDDYVALFRAGAVGAGLAEMRLLGDLGAGRFALNCMLPGEGRGAVAGGLRVPDAAAISSKPGPGLRRGTDSSILRFDTHIAAPGREIAVRIYDPGGESLRPAMLYLHGGGFSLGSIESFDIVGAALAAATGAVVASVQYRRLPETDYPGAQDDCDRALAWLARQAEALGIDPARLVIAGDSAGALLALCCAANARDAGAALPRGLLLFYGTFAMDPADPAYDEAADPLLTGARVRSYIDLFQRCGGGPAPIDRGDLLGLPPAHIIAAEHDPLCAESIAFAARLRGRGVPVSVRVAPGMIHGFLRAAGVSAAARAEIENAARAIGPWLEA